MLAPCLSSRSGTMASSETAGRLHSAPLEAPSTGCASPGSTRNRCSAAWSEASAPAERGSALALGGLGWSVSHLSTPLIMGFLADRYGIITGFYVLGGFALAGALVIAFTRRWAFQAA